RRAPLEHVDMREADVACTRNGNARLQHLKVVDPLVFRSISHRHREQQANGLVASCGGDCCSIGTSKSGCCARMMQRRTTASANRCVVQSTAEGTQDIAKVPPD